MNFKITYASEKGRRGYQEDAYITFKAKDGFVLAVFDGHGGSEVAEFSSEHLAAIFRTAKGTGEEKLRNVFTILSDKTGRDDAGSTASIAFLPDGSNEMIVGILGDSPVLVKRADGTVWVSPEHNVRSNESEARAAEERGGFIHAGYLFSNFSGGGLQMSRALGDSHLGRVLSREPEIFTILINEKSWVLVATDGLFDPAHLSDETSEIISSIESGCEANALVQAALAIPTNDNVTAILLRFS